MTEPFACIALACAFLADPLESCEKRHCPFAWQRRGREDRARREEADRREGARTVQHKKEKNTMPPENQGKPIVPQGGAVPPHSADVVPVPGGRVEENRLRPSWGKYARRAFRARIGGRSRRGRCRARRDEKDARGQVDSLDPLDAT